LNHILLKDFLLPAGGVDGMAFADLLHYIHPLFHQNETTVDGCMNSGVAMVAECMRISTTLARRKIVPCCRHDSMDVQGGIPLSFLCRGCYSTIAPKDGIPGRSVLNWDIQM
jgi:hypothetical protein